MIELGNAMNIKRKQSIIFALFYVSLSLLDNLISSTERDFVVSLPISTETLEANADPDDDDTYRLNKTLTFTGKPFTWCNEEIYIPPRYEEFYDLVLDSKKVIITGNPGIGKSILGVYILQRLLKSGFSVVYFHPPNCFIFENDSATLYRAATQRELSCHLWDTLNQPEVYYLHDICDNMPVTDHDFVCHQIYFSSPKEDNFQLVYKDDNSFVFYMPPFNLYELFAISPMYKPCQIPITEVERMKNKKPSFRSLTEYELLNRYHIFGGIPRYVFSKKLPTIISRRNCSLYAHVNREPRPHRAPTSGDPNTIRYLVRKPAMAYQASRR